MGIKKENYFLIRKLFIKILGGKCAFCGSKDGLEFDHIEPTKTHRHDVSRSVREWEWFAAYLNNNLQLLCKDCNKSKSDSKRIYHIIAGAVL